MQSSHSLGSRFIGHLAQIATFVMKLHGLTTIVWANYPTAGVTGMSNWIMPHGSELTEAIRKELTSPLLVRGPHYTHVYLLHAVYSQTLSTC